MHVNILIVLLIDMIEEESFKNLFLHSPIGLFILQKGLFVLVNNKFEELTGYSKNEVYNIHYETLVYPEDRTTCRLKGIETIKKAQNIPYRFRALRKDNEIRWVMATITSVQYKGIRSALGALLDITEEKILEERLYETMEQLKIVIETVQDGITFSDEEGRFYVFNTEMERLTGYTMDEANSSQNFLALIYPDENEYAKAYERLSLVREKTSLRNIKTVFTTKHGEKRHVLVSTCLIPYKEKTMYLSICHDITEQKQAELALKISEEKYRSIFDNAVEGIFQSTPGGRFLTANPALAKMYGYSSPKELQETITDIWSQLYVESKDRLHLKELLEKDGVIYNFETQLYKKDKSIIWVSINARIVRDESGNILFYEGTVVDITHRKKTEERLNKTLERLRRAIGITVQTISNIVESRDPYTAGHQTKVSRLARVIAKKMKLPDNVIDGIRMAGLIHDIGKVSIPSDILSKPGRLSEIETQLIRIHPKKGYEIIKDVESDWPIAEIILQHHERLDGSGYPQGLKGDEIILEAKILAVADVVEAISSHRPYRPALGIEAALDEIEKNKGKLYDEKVVDACVRLFREDGFVFEKEK